MLASAVPSRRLLPETEQPVREAGQALFAGLLGTGEVAGRYRAAAAVAAERGEGLRVVLRIDTPALASLPWEAMFDQAAGAYVCRQDQLVRHVPVASTATPLRVRPPLRILGVVSSPRGLPPLDVEKEQDQLTRALARPASKGLAELHWAPSATWADLQDLLLDGEWHVLHFIGHGGLRPWPRRGRAGPDRRGRARRSGRGASDGRPAAPGPPGAPPGLIAAQAIGFALFRREKTGKGEAIDVPMLENMASFVASEHLGAATFDPPVGPTGDGRLLSPNYRPVPTKDGYVTVRPNTNAQAFAFFDAIGRPELKADPRFESAASRTRNAKAYFEVQATGLGGKTTDEWVELFDKLDVPAARYNSIDDLMTDPHLKDVGFFKEEDHPSEGKIRRSKLANVFSSGAREKESHAPLYGEHSREILGELGYSAAEIDKMITVKAADEPAKR